jgi:NAD(P)-dependent dehydrogenase (short-subunit alcohol dehydrogenase family)
VISAILREGGRGAAVHHDLRQFEAISDMIDGIEDSLGPIGVLVNNAAIVVDRPFLETSHAQLRDVMGINLEAPFFCAQRVAQSMVRRQSGGRIVNLASHSGLRGSTGRAAYAASKGALIALTRVMAVELAPFKITVNAVAPGPIESAHTRAAHSTARREAWERAVPMGRYGQPGEASAAVLFLASAAASFITGHTLVVDGGFTEAGLLTR